METDKRAIQDNAAPAFVKRHYINAWGVRRWSNPATGNSARLTRDRFFMQIPKDGMPLDEFEDCLIGLGLIIDWDTPPDVAAEVAIEMSEEARVIEMPDEPRRVELPDEPEYEQGPTTPELLAIGDQAKKAAKPKRVVRVRPKPKPQPPKPRPQVKLQYGPVTRTGLIYRYRATIPQKRRES